MAMPLAAILPAEAITGVDTPVNVYGRQHCLSMVNGSAFVDRQDSTRLISLAIEVTEAINYVNRATATRLLTSSNNKNY